MPKYSPKAMRRLAVLEAGTAVACTLLPLIEPVKQVGRGGLVGQQHAGRQTQAMQLQLELAGGSCSWLAEPRRWRRPSCPPPLLPWNSITKTNRSPSSHARTTPWGPPPSAPMWSARCLGCGRAATWSSSCWRSWRGARVRRAGGGCHNCTAPAHPLPLRCCGTPSFRGAGPQGFFSRPLPRPSQLALAPGSCRSLFLPVCFHPAAEELVYGLDEMTTLGQDRLVQVRLKYAAVGCTTVCCVLCILPIRNGACVADARGCRGRALQAAGLGHLGQGRLGRPTTTATHRHPPPSGQLSCRRGAW